MLHSRWRRATMAAVASLCASAAIVPAALAAPGDLPDLVQSIPTAPGTTDADPVTGRTVWSGWFDDHSISGDDHTGWGYDGSDGEPIMVRFQSVLRNQGAGALQVCPASGNGVWRRAVQSAPGDLAACASGSNTLGEIGWYRYAIANHSTFGEFNRWHLMDLQRYALVPVLAGPGDTRRTYWDTRWGTCLNDNEHMDCETSTAGPGRSGIPAGDAKVTEEGAPDQTLVAFPNRIPGGRYQLVAIANPYGAIREAGTTYGSVACVTLDVRHERLEGQTEDTETNGGWMVTESETQLDDCRLPRQIPAPLSGPGGPDPFANAQALTCPEFTATFHCWAEVPESQEPGGHPVARTNVRDTSTPTSTVTVDMYGHVGTYDDGGDTGGGDTGGGDTGGGDTGGGDTGGGDTGGGNTGGGNTGTVTPPAVVPLRPPVRNIPTPVNEPTPLSLPELGARNARKLTRKALRKTFGFVPKSSKVSCRLTGGASSRCKASWRRSGGRKYRANVNIWFSSDATRVRWNYDLKARRTKRGTKSKTYTRGTRVGGTVAS